MSKNIFIDQILNGKEVFIKTIEEKEITNLFNDLLLAETYHWTLEEIRNLNLRDYENILLILQKRNALQNNKLKNGR